MGKTFCSRDHFRGLIKAIRYFGSQQALARTIGTSPQRVSYWLNHAKQIPYEYVIKIEFITQGKITRHELAPNHKELNVIIRVILKPAKN